ncbi:MAG TPA: hypothetical protein VM287_11680 [Egibacteraceae bacterium]|nr:hypothetical protein [Egibacteraceae bacterium]
MTRGTAFIVAVALLAGCATDSPDTEAATAPAPSRAVTPDPAHADGHGDPGPRTAHEHAHTPGQDDATAEATPQERAAAEQLVAATTAGVARFADLAVAKAEGYQAVTPEFLPIVHYVHRGYLTNGDVLDPARPESLVYGVAEDRAVLLGAMFLMPEPGVPGPRIGGPLTTWHTHDDLCFDLEREMVVGLVDARGGCPDGAVNQETPEMMHVWVVDHPEGPFGHDMSPAALRSHLPR